MTYYLRHVDILVKPQICRRLGLTFNSSAKVRVCWYLKTAFATKALAIVVLTAGGQPIKYLCLDTWFSILTSSKTFTKCFSCIVNGVKQHSSKMGNKLRCNLPTH